MHPLLSSRPAEDASALAASAAHCESVLAGLPPKPRRQRSEQAIADSIHETLRNLRHQFMRLHRAWVYEALPRHEVEGLRALVDSAADRFPGLVPTPAQMRHERSFSQIDKEGREIDQAIFLAALLDHPAVGADLVDRLRRPLDASSANLAVFRQRGRLDLPTVQLTRIGRAGIVTLSLPDRLNAEDDQLVVDLETAVDVVLLDESIGVGVFRGGPLTHPKYLGRRVFSAGINLKQIAAGRISYLDFLMRRELGFLNKMLRGLSHVDTPSWNSRPSLEKPWLAAIDGFAIGGGAQIALACDRVIAGDDSFISLPAAQEGFVPGVANLRLGRSTGSRLARQMILAGRRVDANSLQAHLLIDEVVRPDAMDDAIRREVELLDAPSVVVNRRLMRLAEESDEQFRVYMAEFAMLQVLRLYDPDVLRTIAGALAPAPCEAAA